MAISNPLGKGSKHFRLIKYSQCPPLSLMTIAGMTPDDWEITIRDEHVESSEVEGDVAPAEPPQA